MKFGIQFAHVNTYARKPKSGNKGTGFSVADILGEAARNPKNCRHVNSPGTPEQIAGCSPIELLDRIPVLLEERKIAGKNRPKPDVHVLAAAVYSWPEECLSCNMAALRAWITDQITWHLASVGPVDSAVLHLDEPFPHLHIFTVDPDARRLCPGWCAKREALAQGLMGKAVMEAYKSACTVWQDKLWHDVSRFHGLERDGPKRAREPSTGKYLEQKKILMEFERRIAEMQVDAAQLEHSLAQKSAHQMQLNLQLKRLEDDVDLAKKTASVFGREPLRIAPPNQFSINHQVLIDAAGLGLISLEDTDYFTKKQMMDVVTATIKLVTEVVRSDEAARYQPALARAELASTAMMIAEETFELKRLLSSAEFDLQRYKNHILKICEVYPELDAFLASDSGCQIYSPAK